jgi:hypothetical protein
MEFHPIGLLTLKQILLAITAVVALSMSPPRTGEFLLVPLATSDRSVTARVALAGGAMVIDAGPIRGSMIIRGDRRKIADQINSWTMLLTAAPSAGCRQNVDPPSASSDRVK